jgi:hypothetical protein
MATKNEIRQELDKVEPAYHAGDMTEGAAVGKMPGVETSKGEAAGRMRGGDMTEGAAVGKMPGVETSKGEAAGRMRGGDMTEGAAAGKMPGVENI